MVATRALALAVSMVAGACGRFGFDTVTAEGTAMDGPTNVPTNAVAGWRFDEGVGITTMDRTGNGHDGTLIGGDWVVGHTGNAIELTMDYVSVPASPVFDRTAGASFSITSWFRRTGTVSHGFIFEVSFGPSGACYGLEVTSDNSINYWDGVVHLASATVTMDVGVWNHIALVVNSGANATVYFNGVAQAAAQPNNDPHVATAVMIGASNYGEYLQGAVDEVRFFDRALTDAEVAADMLQ